ncbi:MAG: DNA mismatch repair endonuclease MutL [Nitrospirae bacterium]|nr:DNA mismatch repair endonuclease MutL [Nitrospirota bacterium]
MPDRIKHLTQELANQIAAGEVVERPAAVVKELIENSIDAGASQIIIRIEKGGARLISVADDGIGMSRNDAIVAFDRHATSKISANEDLFNIHTMGFRGEALASIASVARVSLNTRERHEIAGTFIEIEGGRLIKSTDTGCPEGTEIEVRDLFFNVPARKSFLKSQNTENGHILSIVTHNALANKGLHFTLYDVNRDNKPVLDFPPVKSLEERVFQIYGEDASKDLAFISFNTEGYSIYGLVSRPYHIFKNKENQIFFVNKRYIKNPALSHAVQQAYMDLIPGDKHPMVILFIDMAPALVDVNVHPSKREVRFRDSQYIHNLVIDAIRGSLRTKKIPVTGEISKNDENERDKNVPPILQGINENGWDKNVSSILNLYPDRRGFPTPPERYSNAHEGFDRSFHVQEIPAGPSIRILGQIGVLFIITEIDGELNIIDQHAAHERVIYDRLKRGYQNGRSDAQYLLIPETIELSLDKVQILIQYISFLNKIGFDIEEMGGRSFIIRSVPAVFSGEDIKVLLTDMISEIISGDYAPGDDMRLTVFDDVIKAVLSRKACHSAVRANGLLSSAEMAILVKDLLNTEMPYTCPHGRPVIRKFSFNDLAGMFGRK